MNQLEKSLENKTNCFEACASAAHAISNLITSPHTKLSEKQVAILVNELTNVTGSMTWALKIMTEGKPEPKIKIADANN